MPPKTPKKRAAASSSKLDTPGNSSGNASSPTEEPAAKRAKTDKKQKLIDPNTRDMPIEEAYQKNMPLFLEAQAKYKTDLVAKNQYTPGIPSDFGARVIEIGAKTNSAPQMAGYLNFRTSQQLNEYVMHDNTITEICKTFHDGRVNNWGHSYKPRFSFLDLQNLLSQQVINMQLISVQGTYPTATSFERGTVGGARMYLAFMRFMFRIHQTGQGSAPNPFTKRMFSGPCEPAASFVYLASFEAEDILRAYIVTRFYALKMDKGTTGSHNKWATLPVFRIGDVTVRTNTTEQDQRNAASMESLNNIATLEAQETFYDNIHEEPTQSEGDATANYEKLDRKVASYSIRLAQSCGNLDPTTQARVIKSMANLTQYKFQDRARINPMFMPAASGAGKEFVDGINEFVEVDDARVLENQKTNSNKKTLETARSDFQRIMRMTNSSRAVLPSWDESVQFLGLDVQSLGEDSEGQPVIDKTTGVDFTVTYRGLPLIPHQPAAITFMTKMLDSPLQGVLLGDGTGLGKTVNALATICECSARLQETLDVWNNSYEEIMGPIRAVWLGKQKGKGNANTTPPTIPDDDELIARTHNLDDTIAALGQKPAHRPVLAAVPPNAMTAWINDVAALFQEADGLGRNIVLHRFTSDTKRSTNFARSVSVAYSASGLDEFVAKLDPDDAQTSRTIIIGTYQAFQKKLLDSSGIVSTAPQVTSPDENSDEDELDEDDGDPDAPKEETENHRARDDIQKGAYRLKCKDDMFSIIIMDEAHRCKTIGSYQSGTLYLFKNNKTLMMTATATSNKISDITGLLEFFWKAIKHDYQAPYDFPDAQKFEYISARLQTKHKGTILTITDLAEMRDILSCLCPANFEEQLKWCGGAMNIEAGTKLMPALQQILMVRRVLGDHINVNGQKIILGDNIPSYYITTKEISFGRPTAALYDRAHVSAVAHLVKKASTRMMAIEGGYEELEEIDEFSDRVRNPRNRRLQHASCAPILDNLRSRMENRANIAYQDLQNKGIDSFATFHAWTKSEFNSPPYSTRIDMVAYICLAAPKLQALLAEIYDVVIEKKLKLIIFADWPINLWTIELLMDVLQLKTCSIRAGITSAKRAEAEFKFNHDADIQIMIASSRSASESINLQLGGSNIVIMDIVNNQTVAQIVGRVARLRQVHEQHIVILAADHTIDQTLQANNTRKTRAMLAGSSAFKIPDDHMKNARTLLQGEIETLSATNPSFDTESYVEDRLRAPIVDAMIRSLYGLRSDRSSWTNVIDVLAKDQLPEEQLYILMNNENCKRLFSGMDDPPNAVVEKKTKMIPFTETAGVVIDTPGRQGVVVAEESKYEPTETDIVEAMVAAAEELAKPMACKVYGYHAEYFIRTVRDMVANPNPLHKQALAVLKIRNAPLDKAHAMFEEFQLMYPEITIKPQSDDPDNTKTVSEETPIITPSWDDLKLDHRSSPLALDPLGDGFMFATPHGSDDEDELASKRLKIWVPRTNLPAQRQSTSPKSSSGDFMSSRKLRQDSLPPTTAKLDGSRKLMLAAPDRKRNSTIPLFDGPRLYGTRFSDRMKGDTGGAPLEVPSAPTEQTVQNKNVFSSSLQAEKGQNAGSVPPNAPTQQQGGDQSMSPANKPKSAVPLPVTPKSDNLEPKQIQAGSQADTSGPEEAHLVRIRKELLSKRTTVKLISEIFRGQFPREFERLMKAKPKKEELVEDFAVCWREREMDNGGAPMEVVHETFANTE